jgi:hypothetical protein
VRPGPFFAKPATRCANVYQPKSQPREASGQLIDTCLSPRYCVGRFSPFISPFCNRRQDHLNFCRASLIALFGAQSDDSSSDFKTGNGDTSFIQGSSHDALDVLHTRDCVCWLHDRCSGGADRILVVGNDQKEFADPTDPWLLGVAGKPFQILVVVDQAATDVDPTVNSAQFFNYNALTFAINGTPASSLSNNPSFDYFGFTDNVFGLLDQIVVGFTAQFNGFSTDLGAAVRLPLTTFAFSERVLEIRFGSLRVVLS